MILFQQQQFVVTSSDGVFVGTLRDQQDEEVANILSEYGLLVHGSLARCEIGCDETSKRKQTIGYRQDPNEPPEG